MHQLLQITKKIVYPALIRLAILVTCLLFVSSCTKEIPLETDFTSEIFIEGFIVNTPQYIVVEVQSTVPVDSQLLEPVNDAVVSLYTQDPDGNEELIYNNFAVEEGVYRSREEIRGTVGNTYWIEVETANGTVYKSSPELLKGRITLTDLSMENGITKVRFIDPKEERNFYLVKFIYYEKGEKLFNVFELASDALFDGNEAAFISTSHEAGDEVHVDVLNLSFNVYQFYLNSFAQYDQQVDYGEESGDPTQLFLPPPAQLNGNIINTSTNRASLGFFGVFNSNYGYVYFGSN